MAPKRRKSGKRNVKQNKKYELKLEQAIINISIDSHIKLLQSKYGSTTHVENT